MLTKSCHPIVFSYLHFSFELTPLQLWTIYSKIKKTQKTAFKPSPQNHSPKERHLPLPYKCHPWLERVGEELGDVTVTLCRHCPREPV